MPVIFEQGYLWITILGVNVAGIGVSALLLSGLLKKKFDVALVTFGFTSLLYGVRLLLVNNLNSPIAQEPSIYLFYSISIITYILPVPLSAFLLHLFGNGWKNSITWAFRVAITFSICGILSDLLWKQPYSLIEINNVLILLYICLMIFNIIWSVSKNRNYLWLVLTGFILFGLFALNDNLVGLGLLPWQWRGEAIGFLLFLSSLGYMAATKFFNNEKKLIAVQNEMDTASRIQLSILPDKMPLIKSLDITARYIPMKAVAGDFYDFITLEDSKLCVLIADVSGHGVGSALIASMIKVAFASQKEIMSNPASLLKAMNLILTDKIHKNFVTAGCLFIDIKDSSLIYSGAGHPPLLLWKKSDNEMIELSENGLILGPFPEAEYINVKLPIDTGDRIILYTDGITEATNMSGSFYGEERLKDFIKSHNHLSAVIFADEFLKQLIEWTGKPVGVSMDDDITLIILDRV